MICKNCGEKNPDSALFCSGCGKNLRLSFKDGAETKVPDFYGFSDIPINPSPSPAADSTPGPTPGHKPHSGSVYPRPVYPKPAPQYYPRGTGGGKYYGKNSHSGRIFLALAAIVLCLFLGINISSNSNAAKSDDGNKSSKETTISDEDNSDEENDENEASEAKDTNSIDGEVNRTSGKAFRFWRTKLSKKEAKVYDYLVEGIAEMETDYKDLPAEVSEKSINKILTYIGSDYPEFFWYYTNCSMSRSNSGIVSSLSFEFGYSKKEKKKLTKEIEEQYSKFVNGIDDKTSDFEAVLRVYQNMINRVDYDSVTLNNQDKNNVNGADSLYSIVGVFVNRKGVCEAYAKTFQYIMNDLGIKAIYVSGTAGGGGHAWNMVKLEGKWYYIDVTWGDYSNTDKSLDSGNNIGYNYFCITTKELLKDHKPDNADLLPECTATKCNYYRRMNLFLDGYDYDTVKAIFKKAVKNGNYCVSFKCDSKKTYKAAINSLFDDSKIYKIIDYCNEKLKKNISDECSYSRDKDNYIITVNLKTVKTS